jgi:hypothetical protein
MKGRSTVNFTYNIPRLKITPTEIFVLELKLAFHSNGMGLEIDLALGQMRRRSDSSYINAVNQSVAIFTVVVA